MTAAALCALVPACDARPSAGGVAAASCPTTRYLLRADPRTIVSNERHRVRVQATRDACGHRAPVRGAKVTLAERRATTDAQGRATLTVTLATGRYLVRLYVRGRLVARARVDAIPYVSR